MLLSNQARPALDALSAEGGFRLLEERRSQVVYRLGRSLTVLYDCLLEDPSGQRKRQSVALTAGPKAPTGGATIEGGGFELRGWIYPHDPALPGLAMWFEEENRRVLLSAIGLDEGGTLRARSYRPGRRAVLELNFPDRRVFVKAVRPSRVGDLQERHRLLADRMPVPKSLGWLPDDGVVVMEGLPGQPMSSGGSVPDAAALEALLGLVPPTEYVVSPLRRRSRGHADRLKAILPAASDRIEELVGRLAGIEPDTQVPAHGDFHAGQVIVDGDVVVGLIDVDTVGMGERADDLATMIGHLHVMALGGRSSHARQAERLLAGFERSHGDLRPRIAAAVLGYASGPWIRQEPDWQTGALQRLDAAEAWL